jgi:hypothetical protein
VNAKKTKKSPIKARQVTCVREAWVCYFCAQFLGARLYEPTDAGVIEHFRAKDRPQARAVAKILRDRAAEPDAEVWGRSYSIGEETHDGRQCAICGSTVEVVRVSNGRNFELPIP